MTIAKGPNWEGDGTTDTAPDDGEWGGDAKAKSNNLGDDEDKDATELARTFESLQVFLHRQALRLRLGAEDAAALRFLIESLNDDGYLEDPLEELAQSLKAAGNTGLAGDRLRADDYGLHGRPRFGRALQPGRVAGGDAARQVESDSIRLPRDGLPPRANPPAR